MLESTVATASEGLACPLLWWSLSLTDILQRYQGLALSSPSPSRLYASAFRTNFQSVGLVHLFGYVIHRFNFLDNALSDAEFEADLEATCYKR